LLEKKGDIIVNLKVDNFGSANVTFNENCTLRLLLLFFSGWKYRVLAKNMTNVQILSGGCKVLRLC